MFNRYKYAANNPYRFTDPDGRQENDSFWVGAAKGAVDTFTVAITTLDNQPTVVFGGADGPVGEGGYKFGSALATAVGVKLPAKGAGATVRVPPPSKTVGRHMSRTELRNMRETGRVQEGAGGQTRVADPPSSETYRAAPAGDTYVEFDVPANRVLPHSEGTGRIPGPTSPDARVPGRNPSDYEMPRADRIRENP